MDLPTPRQERDGLDMNNGFHGMRRRIFLRESLWIVIGFLLFGVLTFFLDDHRVILGIAEFLAALVAAIAGVLASLRRKKQMLEELDHFSYCTEKAVKAAVLSFPSPLVIADLHGNVHWYNEHFKALTGTEELYGTSLRELVPDLQFSIFVENATPTPQAYSSGGKDYLVTGKVIPVGNSGTDTKLVGIYFIDLSEQKRLEKTIADRKTVVCSLLIDNYDEVFKGTQNTNHGSLIAEIEHCVNRWVEKGQGVSVRYDRDKFLILFEAAKFQPLWDEKFSILEEAKAISQGNRLPVTFSIGVGQSKETLQENEELADAALDMALGRGGDQVVVKTDIGFQFYGAKGREIEKNTRVKSRVIAHGIRDLAETSGKVLIMGHKNADADSLGAAVGLFRIFRSLGSDAYIALNREKNHTQLILKELLAHEEYNQRIIGEERAMDCVRDDTLLIVVDAHRPSIVEYPNLLGRCKNIMLVDHHRRSEEYIENLVLSYHEPYVSSSCEMVTEIIQCMDCDKQLQPYEAEALYCGIYLDTKGFTFKTGTKTFEAASYLRRKGVDPINVRRMFSNDMELYLQKSRIISNAKIYRDNIAIALCTEKSKDIQLVVAQAADDLLNIRGIEAAFVLAENGNHIVISGRSLGTVNVQVILEKLGGGGHITIAGAQLQNDRLDQAEEELKAAINETLFE